MENPQLQYVRCTSVYLLSFTQDKSIVKLLKEHGATSIEVRNKLYWSINHQAFDNISLFLKTVGFREFKKKEQARQVAYRIEASKAEPQVTAPRNPMTNLTLVGDELSSEPTLTVGDVNQAIDKSLKDSFPSRFWVRGEVTGFKPSARGHVYFNLIESSAEQKVIASVSMIIWSSRWLQFKDKMDLGTLSEIKDGDEIRVKVEMGFYAPTGKISLSVVEIDAMFAEGEFFKKKAQIEQKLELMGLLNRNSALPRPFLPLRLAVFSNEGAAGWGDFIRILSDSAYPFVVTVFATALQGKSLESSFLRAFEKLRAHGEAHFDYGVIVRGGGGITDLADFNNQAIAEAIARSPLKFIVGIGHERDRTVLDEIAEREPTPTAVANTLVDRLKAIDDHIDRLAKDLDGLARAQMDAAKAQLKDLTYNYSQSIVKRRDESQREIEAYAYKLRELSKNRIHEAYMGLESLRERAKSIAQSVVDREEVDLAKASREIKMSSDMLVLDQKSFLRASVERLESVSGMYLEKRRSEIAEISVKLRHAGENAVTAVNNDFKILHQRFESLHPKHCFERGFVMLQSLDGQRVTSVSDLAQGQDLSAQLSDGKLLLHIDDMQKHEATNDDKS